MYDSTARCKIAKCLTCCISLVGSALRHGKHLKPGKKHHLPLAVKMYVSDLLMAVNSWDFDILRYTSDSICSGVLLLIVRINQGWQGCP